MAKKMKKIAVATLGCKVNQFESASFISSLERTGACQLVPFSRPADVYIINTCAVTGRAGQQSRQLIRRVMKTNPDAKLIVTGCYAQIESGTIMEITDYRACVIGNGNKHLVVSTALADREEADLTMIVGDIGLKKEVCPLPVGRFSGRTRAYLRIQDGCNNFCSYCIVPYTRGRSRSVPLEDILDQMRVFAAEKYPEVVVTGINVGKYGSDLGEGQTIYSLLERLCRDFPDIRIRLSSIEPTEINETLLALMASMPNFMPHLHVPLQSGDDEVLAGMNRRYSTEFFRKTLLKCRGALPDAAIGCDILGGFPGETQAAHENTLKFLNDLPITYLHVFPYSKRPGTPAAAAKAQIPKPIKEERVKQLRELGARKRFEFQQKSIGTSQRVLVERRNKKSGLLQGFSENYLSVRLPGPDSLIGRVIETRIEGLDNEHVLATPPKTNP